MILSNLRVVNSRAGNKARPQRMPCYVFRVQSDECCIVLKDTRNIAMVHRLALANVPHSRFIVWKSGPLAMPELFQPQSKALYRTNDLFHPRSRPFVLCRVGQSWTGVSSATCGPSSFSSVNQGTQHHRQSDLHISDRRKAPANPTAMTAASLLPINVLGHASQHGFYVVLSRSASTLRFEEPLSRANPFNVERTSWMIRGGRFPCLKVFLVHGTLIKYHRAH